MSLSALVGLIGSRITSGQFPKVLKKALKALREDIKELDLQIEEDKI